MIEQQTQDLESLRARVAALQQAGEECVRAQEDLRKSEERFRKIFDHSNDAIFVIDPERDSFLDVNSKACDLLGYSRDELLALPKRAIHSSIHSETDDCSAFARSVFENGRGWTDKLTFLTKAGESLSAEVSASVIELDGRMCMIALVRDITRRKRAEAALQRHSEDLERLVAERTDQLRQSEEHQRVLLEINNAIIANLERESLFDAIAQAVWRVLPFDRAAIYLYDSLRDTLKLYALGGAHPLNEIIPVGGEIPRQGTRVGWVFDQRKPLVGGDMSKEVPWPNDHNVAASLVEAGIRSYLLAPMITKRGATGTLSLASLKTDCYSEGDAELLVEVAKQVALAIENMQAYEEIAGLKARLEQEKIYLQEEIKAAHNFGNIVGQSPAIGRVLKTVETVAPTDATVLLLGETGTGKELIARALHDLSPRKDRALVRVNCAALPAGLIESELFGHEKGAFTGALVRKIGRFELADGGTIFLDEIGDLPPDLQAKLLRVLQEGEFERVGSTSTLKVDVRVIAATHRDLEKASQGGTFRPDLYYRLSVFPIAIPPLRERKEDIPLLVKHFVMKYGGKLGKRVVTVPEKTMTALLDYSWPGNVRELENVIERAVIVSTGAQLELGEWLPKPGFTDMGARILMLEELEREHIIKTLELTGWRVSGERGAAKLLGLKPTTLDARMKKLGITRKGANASNIS
jgi:formate hydrogenlyase transcriptional activator